MQQNLGSDKTVLDVQLKDFPEITTSSILNCPRNPDRSFNAIGPVFLFIPMVVIFFSTVNTIVAEKESSLKQSMEMIGLRSSVFWLAHYLTAGLLVLINALVTVVIGYALGLALFRNSDLGAMYFFFMMYGLAFLSMAMFVSSVATKIRTV